MKLTDIIKTEYETVNPKTVSDIKINFKKTEEVQELVNAFLYFLQHVRDPFLQYHNYETHMNFIAERALVRVQDIPFSSEDITHLTVLMEEHSHTRDYSSAGVFLTKLISNHFKKNPEVSSYTLLLENQRNHLDSLLSFFDGPIVNIFGDVGHNFCSNIENGTIFLHGNVYGNVGENMYNGSVQIYGNVTGKVGKEMKNGSIKIFGNSEDEIGDWMKNGKITVEGNAESLVGKMQEGGEIIIGGKVTQEVGAYMKGGKITIKGDTLSYIGHGMENGTIYLEGSYLGLHKEKNGYINKGKIYHKGKQIFPQEKMNENIYEF